jgi:hypothetical protein
MFQASGIGFYAVGAFAMCWALAVVLYRVSSRGSVARKLSLLLVVEGITLISTGYIDLFITPLGRQQPWYPTWLQAEVIVHTFGDCAMLALYPPFLAAALQTKLTRPFSNKRVQIAIYVASGVLFCLVLLTPLWFGAVLLYVMLALVFNFALIASIHAWRVANELTRARARAFTLAFGFRDLCWGIVYTTAIIWIFKGTYEVVDPAAVGPVYIIYATGTLFAVPLIAYGILRTHLFDIDLRIQWTIKQSTLAAAVVAIIFLISEGADRLLSQELGNFAGLLAAAVVVFFLAPLQRFAERVAGAAMPNTKNTPEYAAFRKMRVYEEALAEALQEGGVSEKERALLVRLRDTLGITESDADAIEAELQGLGDPHPA